MRDLYAEIFPDPKDARIAELERINAEQVRRLGQLEAKLDAALARVTILEEANFRLREENQALRDEVARLKGQKGKPSIGPSRLNQGEKGKHGGGQRQQKAERLPDRTEVRKAKNVPEGSTFKGYADWTVQELVVRTETILYRLEKWLTPEGRLVSGELPSEAAGGHFGATLRSFVLYQYYHTQVTQSLILEELPGPPHFNHLIFDHKFCDLLWAGARNG